MPTTYSWVLPAPVPPSVVPAPAPGSDAYARQLRQLLPPSSLWKLDPSSLLYKVLQALADELSRVGKRGVDFVAETLPSTALETLSDWERVLGLPDECLTEIPSTLSERRVAALTKYVSQGGQSPAYFEAIAAALGYVAVITPSPYKVCRSGTARSGDRCYEEDWAYVWLVTLTGYTIDSRAIARSGTARCGDRLQGYATLNLECIFNRLGPAHTLPLFVYAI